MTWGEADTAASISERFEQQVRLGPDAIAIAGDGQPLTYAELDSRAEAYAETLPAARPTPPLHGGVAALLFAHGADVIVAALAASKRGFAVVTLNPSEPAARHAQVRAAVEPSALLTDERHLEQASTAGFVPTEIAVLSPGAAPGSGSAGGERPTPDGIAFLISTSGSTGRPKIVMQSHRNVLHNVLRYTNGLGIRAEDRIAWLASLSGGQGLATAWTALLNGATLCPYPIVDRGMTGLSAWLADNGVTVFDTVPSVLRNFALTLRGERIEGIRLVRLASEAGLRADFEAFRRHFSDQCALASVLASSEVGIMAQAIIDPGFQSDEQLPVGVEAEGIRVLLHDEDGRQVASGEPGEIVVVSKYLSPGYWRDEELTSQRFELVDGERRLHTGDVARRSDTGMLTVLGRKDSQVKVRGHRLQLEEVEAAIAAQSGVAAVAVTAGSASRGDTRLTAFVAAGPDSTVSSTSLRHALHEVLPPYAVPATFVCVDALPMTPHGKIDRARLSQLEEVLAPAGEAPGQTNGREPASETEELLAAIWRQAFDRDEISLDEPFLELGGDSLTAAVIAAGAHEAFGVELELATFASGITIAKLADLVGRGGASAGEDSLPPLRRRRPPTASSVQRFMWGVAQLDPAGLTLATAYQITGPLNVEALQQSIEQIVARHETLRTTFTEFDGAVVQLIAPPEPVELPLFDLRDDLDPAGRSDDLLTLEVQRGFDLERGPLVRFRLARIGDDEHRLLRINHHLVADAISWRIFFREVAIAYEALINGRTRAPAEEPALQYADYAMWEAACMQLKSRPRYEAEVEWWQRQISQPPPELKLPFMRSRPPEDDDAAGGMIEWGLSPDDARAIDRIGRDGGATYYMTRLAVFSALLALESGARDVLLETYLTTRRGPELQDMIGLFINRTLLRLRFPSAPSFPEWLAEVRHTVIETSANTTIPHTLLRNELKTRGSDLPPARTSFQALYQLPPMRFGGLQLARLPRAQPAPRGFVLGVDRVYDESGCRAVFDPRVYDPALVAGFLARLRALVAAICIQPDAPLPELHGSLAPQ